MFVFVSHTSWNCDNIFCVHMVTELCIVLNSVHYAQFYTGKINDVLDVTLKVKVFSNYSLHFHCMKIKWSIEIFLLYSERNAACNCKLSIIFCLWLSRSSELCECSASVYFWKSSIFVQLTLHITPMFRR